MNLNLSAIAKKIINEDTWGNQPSAAAPQNPGANPTAKSPAPQSDVKFYDVNNDFKLFQNTIDSQEEKAKREFNSTISKNILHKKVTARASKGAIGQIEKDYTFDVVSVDITYMSDKYYVVLKGSDKKDYFINDGFKLKIVGASEDQESEQSSELPKENPKLGEIVYPQNLGLGSNKKV